MLSVLKVPSSIPTKVLKQTAIGGIQVLPVSGLVGPICLIQYETAAYVPVFLPFVPAGAHLWTEIQPSDICTWP